MDVASPARTLAPRRMAPHDVQEFLQFEARLLNERQFEQWLTLLTDDVCFWVPLRHGQESGEHEASLFFDHRELIEARINRLRHPRIWSQLPPVHAMRIVANSMLDEAYHDNATVHSQFIMLDFRLGTQRVFGGTYEHVLRNVDGQFRIARKTVRLVNCEAMLNNLAVPF
jgi:3-phenylpropionate/cinnamic acid dioxygenase small subunit